MIAKKIREILKKQHYALAGKNSAVQICRWTKKSLLNDGFCYKQQFYGIESHKCCQMSPAAAWCQNRCIHCWRPIELTLKGKISKKQADKPEKLIQDCIEAQKKLLSGFKGNKKTNMKKFLEAQNPTQFAISLIGEPTIYPYLAELIKELRKQNKTSFLVTNGLNPARLLELEKKKALPTQLYISLNTPNKNLYEKWHNSREKKAWKKFNKSLEIINKLTKAKKTRTVIRITLVKDENMIEPENYAKLIKKAMPLFIEVKGYMSVGYARKRLGYEKMPTHAEIRNFTGKILKHLKKYKETKEYKILDEKIESRVVLLGRDKRRMKIKKSEI